jgi:glucose-6-phosphate isomerase
MEYTHRIDACFSDASGVPNLGTNRLTPAQYKNALARTQPALDQLRRWRDDGTLPLLALPYRQDDIDVIAPIATRFRNSFDDVIVLGAGGSSLGGKCLYALADCGWGPPKGTPRLHFMDNVDPHSFTALFAAVDWTRTGLLTISKSGGTAETMTQTTICLAQMSQAVGVGALRNHVVAITEASTARSGENPLRALAQRRDIPVLDHDPQLGGRYAALSIVGILPSMIAGLDPVALRAGAAAVLDETLRADDPADSAPAIGAALSVGLAQECEITATVIMPYLDRLTWFASWHRQLWAESLGKNGGGTTSINALGAVDQHSQAQLYLDGPADKMFTFIHGPSAGAGEIVSESCIDYLEGRHMGDLLNACQRATAETLAAHNRPVRIMELTALNERTMGALMMHFMLETIIAGHLLNVDPFDQPAVEEGKVLARRYMAELCA